MKGSFIFAIGLAVASLFLPPAVSAHHGDAGRYIEEVISLTGSVAEVKFVNPHSLIMFDVTENGKTIRWTAELGGPQQLAKQFGWTTTTLKPGTKVTMIGRRVKSGAPYLNLTERSNIVLTDSGKEIYRTENFGQPTPSAPAAAPAQPY
jgi:uncharacterized protein DUF6152